MKNHIKDMSVKMKTITGISEIFRGFAIDLTIEDWVNCGMTDEELIHYSTNVNYPNALEALEIRKSPLYKALRENT